MTKFVKIVAVLALVGGLAACASAQSSEVSGADTTFTRAQTK